MKVLHFSQFNTVNVPLTFARLYRAHGHESRLLTLYRHRGNIEEDICLHKRIFNPPWLQWLRHRREKTAAYRRNDQRSRGGLFLFRPSSPLETWLLAGRDLLRKATFSRLSRQYGLCDFDLYCFHGGIDFFRNAYWVRQLSRRGKTVMCHYHGPDLRTRGLIEQVHALSSLNITNEFDLLEFLPGLRYVPIPFDVDPLPAATRPHEKLTILHTPSNPAAKGTPLIEPVLRRIAAERQVDFTILTGVSRQEVLAAKQTCDIAVEQVGNFGGTGYGVNSLETLAMNIPTVTDFTPAYARFLKGHPFVLATPDTLYTVLLQLVDNAALRRKYGSKGRAWVMREHGFENVWKVLLGHMRETIPAMAARLEL